MQLEEREFEQHAIKMIEFLLESDPERAKDVLSKSVALIEDARELGQWSHAPPTNLVNNLLSVRRSNLNRLAFAVDLIRDVNVPIAPFSAKILQRHYHAVHQLHRKCRNSQLPDQLKQLQTFYRRLGPTLGQGDLSGVTLCFREVVQTNVAIPWAR